MVNWCNLSCCMFFSCNKQNSFAKTRRF